MLEFPAKPLAPVDFMERWLPEAFAELPLPEGADQLDVQLGPLGAVDERGIVLLTQETLILLLQEQGTYRI